jgi:exosome complex exonuclease DIS3/RRP44
MSLYQRLRKIIENENKHFYVFSNEYHKDTYIERKEGESANDRNDRAIRVASLWYMRTLSETKKIFLLTNDKENLNKALKEEINAKTVFEFIRGNFDSDLLDLLNYTEDIENKSEEKNEFFEKVINISN